jgi:hypothetical protein
MRRFVLAFLAILIGMTALLSSRGRVVQAQSYGPDLSGTGTAYSCGDASGHASSSAFDDNINTYWNSSQSSAAVPGTSCIGQNFGETRYQIRRISLKHATNGSVSSVIVQNSSNGSIWNTVDTINSIPADTSIHYYDIAASAAYPYWRLLANSVPVVGTTWAVQELEMMETLSWPTDTPGPSSTPTITLTPSITPSPTPNFEEVITSTSGPAMRIDHSASYGEQNIFGALIAIAFILVIWLALWFWGGHINA